MKTKIQKNKQVIEAMSQKTIADWIEFDKTKFEATLTRLPERSELNQEINDSLIVEYYSK
jgi:small subunit ribosomal protein S4